MTICCSSYWFIRYKFGYSCGFMRSLEFLLLRVYWYPITRMYKSIENLYVHATKKNTRVVVQKYAAQPYHQYLSFYAFITFQITYTQISDLAYDLYIHKYGDLLHKPLFQVICTCYIFGKNCYDASPKHRYFSLVIQQICNSHTNDGSQKY